MLIVDSGSGMSQAGFADISLRAVLLSIVAWPQMLGIMAVMDQKEFLAFLNPGNGMCKGRIAGFAPRYVFPGPRACRYGPDVQLCSWVVLLVTLHLALCALLFRPAQMLGIMAGMNQKDLSALLGSTVATCSCHSTEVCGISRIFSVKVVLGP